MTNNHSNHNQNSEKPEAYFAKKEEVYFAKREDQRLEEIGNFVEEESRLDEVEHFLQGEEKRLEEMVKKMKANGRTEEQICHFLSRRASHYMRFMDRYCNSRRTEEYKKEE